jgi:2'-5' RNA ligase
MVTEHSIWLMPTGKAQQELENIIRRLSAEYSTPLFPPHVTLIGELHGSQEEHLSKARQLAQLLEPYELRLSLVDCLDQYHRALFVHIEETPAVIRANRLARQVFGLEGDFKYMPHLSLLYGDFPPEVKEAMIAKTGKQLTQRFLADRIYLHSTLGDTKEWYALGEFALAQAGDSKK